MICLVASCFSSCRLYLLFTILKCVSWKNTTIKNKSVYFSYLRSFMKVLYLEQLSIPNYCICSLFISWFSLSVGCSCSHNMSIDQFKFSFVNQSVFVSKLSYWILTSGHCSTGIYENVKGSLCNPCILVLFCGILTQQALSRECIFIGNPILRAFSL